MFDPNETIEHELDPAARECLQRTRSGVLNVLVGVGMVVALSGAALRGGGREPAGAGPIRRPRSLTGSAPRPPGRP